MVLDTEGNEYGGNFETLLLVYSEIKELHVKASVTSIYGKDYNHNAFFNCRNSVKSVTFEPDSKLERIDDYAVCYCSSLLSVDLRPCTKLVYLGDETFSECSNLGTIYIPSSVKTIQKWCFWGSGIKEITIPKSVTLLNTGSLAHMFYLKKVHFEPGIQLKEFAVRLFEDSRIEEVEIPPSVEKIHGSSFSQNFYLKNITVTGNHFKIINGMLCTFDETKVVTCPASYNLESVTVPSTVTILRNHSFSECRSKQVILSNILEYIGESAFEGAYITDLIIPQNVKEIWWYGFKSCKGLKKVEIKSTLMTVIRWECFKYDDALTTVILPDTIKLFEEYCFERCSALTSINIPSNLEEMRTSVFKGCKSLGNVTLPANMNKFGGGVFSGCTNINLTFEEGSNYSIDNQFLVYSSNNENLCQYIGSEPGAIVTISAKCKNILGSAFAESTSITEIHFEEGSICDYIYERAFTNCYNLVVFDFPPRTTYIGECAFENTLIPSVTFTEYIWYIYYSAFKNCTKLTTVTFPEQTKWNLTISNVAFEYCNLITEMVLPEGLVNIREWAFYGMEGLKTITFPTTLELVSFELLSLSNVETIMFRNNISNLENVAAKSFRQCCNLKNFIFPEGFKNIKSKAFEECSFQTVELPMSLEKLETHAFHNCPNLVKISVKPGNSQLSVIEAGFAEDCPLLEFVICENKHFVNRKDALYTSDLTRIVIFPPASKTQFVYIYSQVITISPNTFQGCSRIYSILLPDDSALTEIGAKAFADCKNLRTINIPEGASSVGIDSFVGCDMLSCELIIGNKTIEYKNHLIKVAKIPKRCFIPCKIYQSVLGCTNLRFPPIALMFMMVND